MGSNVATRRFAILCLIFLSCSKGLRHVVEEQGCGAECPLSGAPGRSI